MSGKEFTMHHTLLICLFSLTIGLVAGQDKSVRTVKKAFDSANIPGALGITFNPRFLLEVTLAQPTGPAITLHAGIQLPRNATVGPATFTAVGDIDTGGPFVIAATDPDAPTPQMPTHAQVRHFLGSDFFVARRSRTKRVHRLVNQTAPITPYRQPSPPAGSDAHRYVFLLFKQPPGFDAQTLVNSTTPTSLFNISAFAAATGLGSPIAGTYMLVAPDSSI